MELLNILVIALSILSIFGVCSTCNGTSRFENSLDEPDAQPMKCSPWKYDKYNNSKCTCGERIHDIVICHENESTIRLLTCHCMSYSDSGNDIVVGACPYLCTNYFYTYIHDYDNLSELCDRDIHQNRQGQMCGQCKDEHSPSPYSYSLKCAHCKHYKHNWLKYILIAYLPLTLFFLVVIFFRLNALSGSMNALIFYCQIVSSPAIMSLLSTFVSFSAEHPFKHHFDVTAIMDIMATVYGVWNLDFFRMVYKPFCLHPSLSIIHTLCLDYAIAVYPLLLIAFTYLLIKLHEKLEIIQLVWRPVMWLFTKFNRQWKGSNSLIEAFATFILLSYVKIINTSFSILMPTRLHNVSGDVGRLYTYYNGSMEYFGRNHFPYAVLAIIMFVTFNLVPLILLFVYPCRCFQSCLNLCGLNSQVLRTFMDAFQGCYKFEPYDCRYWAAFYLLLRVAALAIFALTQSGYFVLAGGLLLIPIIVLAAVIKPYRETVHNVVDVVILLSLLQGFFSVAGISLCTFDQRYQTFVCIMLGTSFLTPIVYMLSLAVYKLMPKSWIAYIKKMCIDGFCLRRGAGTEDPLLTHLEESVDFERTRLLHHNVPRYNGLLEEYTLNS